MEYQYAIDEFRNKNNLVEYAAKFREIKTYTVLYLFDFELYGKWFYIGRYNLKQNAPYKTECISKTEKLIEVHKERVGALTFKKTTHYV